MIKTTRTTPLRLRMIDAMVLRGFAERTQGAYVAAVRLLAEHHHRSPDLLSDEQVQGYLLHLLQTRHLSRSTVNQAACAARFLYCDVLGQTERRPQIPLGKRGQRLPEVLSRAEVAALLDACISCKALTFLKVAYASGLRLSEVCGLRVCDIDSAGDRMCIRVVQGKGGQDRYALLDEALLVQRKRSANPPLRVQPIEAAMRLCRGLSGSGGVVQGRLGRLRRAPVVR